jgi:hypothetical protein
MKKIIFILTLFGLVNLTAFAEESITITTYYPSPYGSYNQLSTNRLAVGDTNNNGQLDAGDQPGNNGDIRLKPHTSAPPAETGVVGEVAYASDGYLYVHNGSSTWVKQGGGGCYVDYSGSCHTGFTNEGVVGSWAGCSFAYDIDMGGNNYRFYYGYFSPTGDCSGGWVEKSGKAYLCCKP